MPTLLDPGALPAPLPLFDSAATRRLEHAAASALPPHTLMQRAGLAAARLARAISPYARCAWLACGPGNNGGDGFEAAMHLQQWGTPTVITWPGDINRLPADAHASLQRARAAGVRFAAQPPALGPLDLCVDAVLGLGARRAPESVWADLLHTLHAHARASAAPLLALDLPSGLDADTGVWHRTPGDAGEGLHRHTLSLLSLKPGLFTAQGRDACGTLWHDAIGVQPGAEPPSAWLNAAAPARARARDSHKGSFGDVAVLGGYTHAGHGQAMAGAALLAARAALHAGAGRVYVALLGQGGPLWDSAQPELMFCPPAAIEPARMTVVAGCGGGVAVADALPDVLHRAQQLVLDADALNALAASAALRAALSERASRGQHTVLTPHPLEAARLLGSTVAQVQADRLGAARTLAAQWACTVVLKGSGSVVASPGQAPTLNPTGNARLATAGTGDVLAGLLGARLAGCLLPHAAACQAVYLHGRLADTWPASSPFCASALACALQA